jgi:hypothetical protein
MSETEAKEEAAETKSPCTTCGGCGKLDDRGFPLTGQPYFCTVKCPACSGGTIVPAAERGRATVNGTPKRSIFVFDLKRALQLAARDGCEVEIINANGLEAINLATGFIVDNDPTQERDEQFLPEHLRERVDECCAWARSRIAACRAEEQKFGAGDVAVEASTERRALQAVLRILTGEETS